MNELKLFRETQGYQVSTYLVSNNDHYFSIKTHIDNLYNVDNQLKYILIFGNVEDVPTLMKSGTGENFQYQTALNLNYTSAASDLSYGMINDELKLCIGRLVAGDNIYNTLNELTDNEKITNVQNQIDKIKSYESLVDELISNYQNIDLTNYKHIVGIASNEGPGIDNLNDNEFIRSELLKYKDINFNFTELYQGTLPISNPDTNNNYDLSGDPTNTSLVNSINEGLSLLLYTGHANETTLSTTNFNVFNVDQINENSNLFLACVVGCSLGSYDERYLSLSEKLQIAKNKGSIAIFSSSVLQTWIPPMYIQRTLNDKIINSDSIMTVGELFNEAVSVEEFRNSYDYWFYNLLGDPCTRYILTIPELRYKKVYKGDFTGKGYFDNNDIKTLAKYLVNDSNTLNQLSQIENLNYVADFKSDGVVNICDLVQAENKLLNINGFNIEEFKYM
jgi:hypothetical protein